MGTKPRKLLKLLAALSALGLLVWVYLFPPAFIGGESVLPAHADTTAFAAGDGRLRQGLDELDTMLYDAALGAIREQKAQVEVRNLNYTTEAVEGVILRILYDHPELFYVDFGGCHYLIDSGGLTLSFSYIYTPADVAEMSAAIETAAERILTGAGGLVGEYEKAVYVHDELAAGCLYDSSVSKDHIHNIYGALVAGEAVCDGYAHAYQYLLNRLGIDCRYVTGQAVIDDVSDGHAWVVASLDGKFTAIDPTWDDNDFETHGRTSDTPNMASHAYFGLSEQEMALDHKADDMAGGLPEAVSDSWYERNGLKAATPDELTEAAAQMLCDTLDGKTGCFEVMITDLGAFKDMCESTEGGIGDIVERANELLDEGDSGAQFESEVFYYVLSEPMGCLLAVARLAEE